MDKKVRSPRVGRAEQSIGGSPPAPRILIAATLAITLAAAVVGQARVSGQVGDSNGPRLPAITGTAITWGTDVEFESAFLVVVGRSQTNSLTQRTFGRREAIELDVARPALPDGRYKYRTLLILAPKPVGAWCPRGGRRRSRPGPPKVSEGNRPERCLPCSRRASGPT